MSEGLFQPIHLLIILGGVLVGALPVFVVLRLLGKAGTRL